MLKPFFEWLMEGAKRYSPPLVVTKSLAGLMGADLVPTKNGFAIPDPWPMVTSMPDFPGTGKFGLSAHAFWINP